MTQTPADTLDLEDDTDTPHPVDVLIRVIVILLTPMFLSGADGNAGFASMAALETIRSYRAQNHASLIKVANVIAFGLATLGSLSLSLTDDVPIPLILKLRSNANALDRSAQRNERAVALATPIADAPRTVPPLADATPKQEFDETAVLASVAEASQRAAEFRASVQAPKAVVASAPAPARVRAAASSPAPFRSQWAAAMAEVAAEDMAALASLPPSQRKVTTARAAILSSTANSLLSGTPVDYMTMVQPVRAPFMLSPVHAKPGSTSGV